MPRKKEGKFIVLEGPDGCGKSTQVELLSNWLKNEKYQVKHTKEPTDNPIGKVLRKSLNDEIEMPPETQALLFAGDRSLHVSNIIKPCLESGKIVITGRYLPSSLVYQPSLGLSREWIEKINKYAINPDLTIVIDVPPEVGTKRVDNTGDSDKFESNLELQKKVRNSYKKLAKEKNYPIIDGTKPKETVHEKIKNKVKKILHADLSR